jgi:hypothetical protein
MPEKMPRGDEQRIVLAGVLLPVAAAELLLDQLVLRRRIRDAEQRLGQHHQR